MSNLINDMKSLIENIEDSQLTKKIENVGSEYNIMSVTPVLVFMKDGKVENHEMGAPMKLENFALMSAHKVDEYNDNIIIYGFVNIADDVNKDSDAIKVTSSGVSMTNTSIHKAVNGNISQ